MLQWWGLVAGQHAQGVALDLLLGGRTEETTDGGLELRLRIGSALAREEEARSIGIALQSADAGSPVTQAQPFPPVGELHGPRLGNQGVHIGIRGLSLYRLTQQQQ